MRGGSPDHSLYHPLEVEDGAVPLPPLHFLNSLLKAVVSPLQFYHPHPVDHSLARTLRVFGGGILAAGPVDSHDDEKA